MSDGFLVRFAGTLIEVCNASEKLKKFCRDYIEEPSATPDFSVSLTADNFSDEVLELHEKVSEKLPLYGSF